MSDAISLRQALKYLERRMTVEAGEIPDVPVRGVVFDSRRVAPGDVFVAVRGFSDDGHRYAADAAARGVAAVVGETDGPGGVDVPWLRVPDSRRALAYLADLVFGHPSAALHVTGITGTNGKTTTACLLQVVFNACGKSCGLLGTLVADAGRRRVPARLTTPEAPEIQGWFTEMRSAGLGHAVMEVSAHGIALHRVTGITFDLGVVLNVDLDHLDFTPCFEEYARVKRAFVDLLPPGKPVVLNADDPTVARFVAARPEAAVTISAGGPADVTVAGIRTEGWVTRMTVRVNRTLGGGGGAVEPGEFMVPTLLPGRHNVHNVLAAFTAALLCGVEPRAAAAAIGGFRGVERRLEWLSRGAVPVLDDTAMNPASIDAVFDTVRRLPFGKLVVVNAVRGNRGPVINGLNGAALARWVRRLDRVELISTAAVSHTGPNDRVTPAEEEAFLEALRRAGLRPRHHEELEPALARAADLVGPGDVLLLLGAQGMDAGGRLAMEMLAQRGLTGPGPALTAARPHPETAAGART